MIINGGRGVKSRTTLLVVLVVIAVAAVGCGSLGRQVASLTGWSKTCVEGVSYLQFPSGVTVQYGTDGKIVTCK